MPWGGRNHLMDYQGWLVVLFTSASFFSGTGEILCGYRDYEINFEVREMEKGMTGR